jgi:hypothetical protein
MSLILLKRVLSKAKERNAKGQGKLHKLISNPGVMSVFPMSGQSKHKIGLRFNWEGSLFVTMRT